MVYTTKSVSNEYQMNCFEKLVVLYTRKIRSMYKGQVCATDGVNPGKRRDQQWEGLCWIRKDGNADRVIYSRTPAAFKSAKSLTT